MSLKVGIMQPYFLPYIGYWQLMKYVDVFVIYDNIQYTKKGWINRNRFLNNGEDKYFTIPLKKDSDYFNVNQRYISENFDREKLMNQIKTAYGKAPYFEKIFPIFQSLVLCEKKNLFDYIYYSIEQVKSLLHISTPLIVSSSLDIDFSLKGQEKVQAICRALRGEEYVNPIGGVNLYDKESFKNQGIKLYFLQSDSEKIKYRQFGDSFIPALSILDVLMFNSLEQIEQLLQLYKIM